MKTGRLEAFSDGVFAIIITIMMLELKVPHGGTLEALRPLLPVFLSYVLSFVYVGIYWNNRHHLLHAAQHVTGGTLWANLHLLFWLSLTPFTTAWMGENNSTSWPVALYGMVLVCSSMAYFILSQVMVASHGAGSKLADSIGRDTKGKISAAVYLVAIPLSFRWPLRACAGYALVAMMWLLPDPRIERSA